MIQIYNGLCGGEMSQGRQHDKIETEVERFTKTASLLGEGQFAEVEVQALYDELFTKANLRKRVAQIQQQEMQ